MFAVGLSSRGAVMFSEDFEKGLSKRWEPHEFEEMTDYAAIKEGDNTVLQAKAQKAGSLIAAKFNFDVKPGTTVSWRWKIDKTPPGGSDDKKATFDHTARLFVAFKTSIGPPRTINYVWANKAGVGTTFHHPSSSRSRWIVLESGDGKAGAWQKNSRDIAADWKLLFGDDAPPNIVGIGVMTDSDGTKSTVTGWYDDLVIAGK